MGIIDLDRAGPLPPATPGAHGRRRSWLVGLILLAAAGFIGGFVGHRGPARKPTTPESPAISLVVVSDPRRWVGDSADASASVGGKVTVVAVMTHATIVNGGSTAVRVLGLEAVEPGLTVRDVDAARLLEPGGTLAAPLQIHVDCAASRRLVAISVSLSVETLAGDHRAIPTTIGDRSLVRQVEDVCAGSARPRSGDR